MSIISISADSHCRGDEVARKVATDLDLKLVDDPAVCRVAADRTGVSAERVAQWMHGPRPFIRDSESTRVRGIAWLRRSLLEQIAGADALVLGSVSFLLSRRLRDVVRIGLVAPPAHRVEVAVASGLAPRAAERSIARDDEYRLSWCDRIVGRRPWDPALYDLVLAMQERSVDEATAAVVRAAAELAEAAASEAEAAWTDAVLEAEIAVRLADEGHEVEVHSQGGKVTVLLARGGLFPDRVKDEVATLVREIDGVGEVEVRLGPRSTEPDAIERRLGSVAPRVLLVDDERDFVDTLSERLRARDFDDTAIAYDGEQALSMMESDEPEVMVLDLRMPGIDGLEVLRRVKRQHPLTQVIILTGHGSDAEESLAAELGAFAYLRKPVNIEHLTETMNAARRAGRRLAAEEVRD